MLLLLALVVFLVVWKWHDISAAIALWRLMSVKLLVAAIVTQLVSYGMSTLLLRRLIVIQGYSYSTSRLYKIVTVFNFLNRALPSLGVSGIAFMVQQMYQDGLSRGRSLIIAILYYTNLYLAFFVLFVVCAVYVATQYSLAALHLTAIMFAIMLVVVVYLIIAYVVSKKSRLLSVIVWLFGLVGKFRSGAKDMLNTKMQTILHEVEEVYESWWVYWHKPIQKVVPLGVGGLQHVVDILTVTIVFAGLGFDVPLMILATSYIVATVASFVSFIPSGIGVFEAAMVLVLKSFDVPVAEALSGVLAFRILFYWLPVPIGLYFFKHMHATRSGKGADSVVQKISH